jgi:N-dimethylarginine dimethylaminohydrolase
MLNEYSHLRRVAVRHPRDLFRDQAYCQRNWAAHDFIGEPDVKRAVDQYERFIAALTSRGAELVWFDADDRFSLASLYTRDSSVRTPNGMLPTRMANGYRSAEPDVDAERYARAGHTILPGITAPGTLEGGDVCWLNDNLCTVGEGYRTNGEGIRQLRNSLPGHVQLEVMQTPYFRGPDECLHLMSVLSPVDSDLAVVYAPPMSIRFHRWLQDELGMRFIFVPDAEYDAQGANVLAIAPRTVLLCEGCPITQRKLEAEGCDVITYPGHDICVLGVGGPTCLTQPLERG